MNGIVRVALQPACSLTIADNAPYRKSTSDYVELRFERFMRRGQVSLMCFTREAELAMLLAPDFLPGQRATVQDLQAQNDRLSKVLMKAIAGHLG